MSVHESVQPTNESIQPVQEKAMASYVSVQEKALAVAACVSESLNTYEKTRRSELEALIEEHNKQTAVKRDAYQSKINMAMNISRSEGYDFQTTTRDIRDFRAHHSVDEHCYGMTLNELTEYDSRAFLSLDSGRFAFGFDGKTRKYDEEDILFGAVDYVDQNGVVAHWECGTRSSFGPINSDMRGFFLHKVTCPGGRMFKYNSNAFYTIDNGEMVENFFTALDVVTAFPESARSSGENIYSGVFRTGPFWCYNGSNYTSFYNPLSRKKLTFSNSKVKYQNIPLFNKRIFTCGTITVEVPIDLLF